MFVTNWISTTKIQKISEITNFFRHYFLSRTEVYIDYLYLCKGYNGHLKELRLLFAPECIILDASLSEHRKQLFEEECKQSGLRFISLSEKGSVRFLL